MQGYLGLQSKYDHVNTMKFDINIDQRNINNRLKSVSVELISAGVFYLVHQH